MMVGDRKASQSGVLLKSANMGFENTASYQTSISLV